MPRGRGSSTGTSGLARRPTAVVSRCPLETLWCSWIPIR